MADTLRTDALDPGTDADLLPSLYAAIESANDAVIIFDCTGPTEPYLFRYVNRMFEIQTGFSREEVLGRPAKMLFGADTDLNLLAVWRAELHKGRAMKGEVLKYRKNGTAFWCEVNMRRVSDGPGAYHVISIQRDISARKKHEQRLEQTRSILGAVVENTAAAIYACDLSGRLLLANERFAAVAGIAREKLAGRKTETVLPSELASMIRRNNERALAAQTAVVDEERVRDAAGSQRTFLTLTFLLRDDEGDVFGICGTSTDITDRVEARARLEMFSYAMDIATDGICIFERDGDEWRISYANQMFETMTGYSAAELYGFTSDFLMDGAQDQLAESRAALLRGQDIRTRRCMRRKDGTTFWTAANGRPMMDDSGNVTHSILLYRDITEDVMREHKLSHEASHDPLTGVYNRRFALDALDAALAECRREDAHHTLVVFDLDEFKPVNDRHGHEAGDKLLTELTAAVSARVRAHDTFARMGGDEFCVLFRECSDVRSMGNEILDAIGRVAVVWGGERLSVSASIGAIALTPAMGDAHAALRQADAACYAAKRGGKNRVVVA